MIFRNEFRYKRLEFDFNPRTFEFLAVSLTLNRVRTIVVSIYRPDGKSRSFCDELSRLLELIIVFNCNILLLGDVNIHLDAADLPDAVGFNTIMDCFGLSRVNAANEPTH